MSDQPHERLHARALSEICRNGHLRTPENTAINRRGVAECRECQREAKKRHRDAAVKAFTDAGSITICPRCGVGRQVAYGTWVHLKKMPRLCRSCSRKDVRSAMKFAPVTCRKCGVAFAGRSGAARFCDACARRKPRPIKSCQVCAKQYTGYKGKKACSPACLRRIRKNISYFGGRMYEAVGWAEKVCQVCARHVTTRAHVHHVLGHPDHSMLVVLCAGCHDLVSKFAMRKRFTSAEFRRIEWFADAQRNRALPAGVDIPAPILAPRLT